jgi:hypothetical protein
VAQEKVARTSRMSSGYQYDSTQVSEHWGEKKQKEQSRFLPFTRKISKYRPSFPFFLFFWQVIFRFSLFGWVNLYFSPISCSAPIPFGIESLNLRLTFVAAASASQFLFTLLRLPPISLSLSLQTHRLLFPRFLMEKQSKHFVDDDVREKTKTKYQHFPFFS